MWFAKPSGAYAEGSTECESNIKAFYDLTSSLGYTKEATAGMLGCVAHESGFNPWRWQDDEVSVTSDSKGYGLFQYTPAYGYIENYGLGVEGYGPNMSTSIIQGGLLTDGEAQIRAIPASGKYGTNPKRIAAVEPYVPNYADYDTLDEFKNCSVVYDACAIWLAFFEGLTVDFGSYLSPRATSAQYCYEVIQNYEPTPTPTVPEILVMLAGGSNLIRKHRKKK